MKGFPFWMIMISAGLKGINTDIYDAAAVDGAAGWKLVWYIIMPLLKFPLFVTSTLAFIWTFNYFDLIFGMTGGGPLDATRNIPLYIYDTLSSLVLANLAFAVPVAIWLLIGFFDSIPDELTEAAHIDGASQLGVLFRIIIPLSINGILATTMYIFISTWSELLFAVTFTTSDAKATLPVLLSSFRGQYSVDWAGLLAASTFTALPVALLFLRLQRFFIEGITAGATKA